MKRNVAIRRVTPGLRSRNCVLALVSALLGPLAPDAFAQSCPDVDATVVSVQGTVEAKRVQATAWQPVQLNETYCPGDAVRAGANSRADLSLADQSVLRIGANASVVLQGVKEQKAYVLELLQGAAHLFSRHGDRNLEVQTPFTVAGVRGTEFSVDVSDDAAIVRVFEGQVLASNDTGSVMLADGQSAVAEKGRAPMLRIEAHPRDAVRWTLYYVPVLYVADDVPKDAPAWKRQVAQSAQALREGDAARAFALIQDVTPQDVTDAGFLAYRASLSLAVGNHEAAKKDLDEALARDPAQSDALALRAVIALAENDEPRARAAADRAVSADPASATARIALSYAQQARFDLDGARTSLREAVRLDDQNALAWARLAEIESSHGNLDGALRAARRASALEPNLSRTQTVLGFASLTRVDVPQARAAFERAIALDSADPLPRLGLGLAKIRKGDLKDGARDIEVAASLDPGSALIRSYLGKAYFEEKRTGLDEREYATAKKLDPNDPTPWFYDAIAKQTTNRPVEALRDFDRAIDLNDNRAVYRSRLLLDADLASRSAGLGRIYGDLGFQNLALVEGWKSVNTDASNYSAHRLLADSYAALPRHEIARVSELLQSQLLQPINISPIQPRLGESNLFLVSSQGPAALSFNEFTPLFNRNQVAVQASGLGGSDDTWSGEAIVSGIQDKASFSLGYSGYWTDGYRDNNDQGDNVGTLFTQLELTPKTSVQTEVRYRDRNNGDLELRFLKDDFSRFSDESNTSYSMRGGLRHAFSPGSVVLLSYIHQSADTDYSDFIPDPIFGDFSVDLDVDETGDSGEAQHIYRAASLAWTRGVLRTLNVTSGVGHFNVDAKELTTTLFDPGFPIPPDVIKRRPDVSHTNVYSYASIGIPADVTLTLGVSGDFFDEEDGVGTENQANPKVGLTWNPSFSKGTTLRAAAFRTLTRTLLTGQTLEPTQVAGFNQFYDDAPGTDAWRYGGAIDQKFTRSLFGGLEFSKRDLQVPQSIFGGDSYIVQKTDWDEKLGRAYLFWTPHEWIAASAEYDYERMHRDPDAYFAFKNVETHRVPLGLRFFHPCGAALSFGATYLNQDGDFLRNSDASFVSGNRNFWVLDTGVRYRLPRRYGFVTFGVNNFLDEKSPYQSTDVRNPQYRPGRFVFASVTLAFP